jgi:hypothetical protein
MHSCRRVSAASTYTRQASVGMLHQAAPRSTLHLLLVHAEPTRGGSSLWPQQPLCCPLLPQYAVTDVAIVTSLRDGMNLVSYEYVACQSDNAGVLVLSEFAGAAQSLGAGAILVNPWNITDMSQVCVGRHVTCVCGEACHRCVWGDMSQVCVGSRWRWSPLDCCQCCCVPVLTGGGAVCGCLCWCPTASTAQQRGSSPGPQARRGTCSRAEPAPQLLCMLPQTSIPSTTRAPAQQAGSSLASTALPLPAAPPTPPPPAPSGHV